MPDRTVTFEIRGLKALLGRFRFITLGGLDLAIRGKIDQAAEVLIGAMQNQLDKGPAAEVGSSGPRVEDVSLPKNTTEHLRRVTSRLIQSIGKKVSRIPGGWQAAVGPQRVVYGPIHEFGGFAGRGHAVYIKPRPYAYPALDDAEDEIKEVLDDALAVVR